MTDPDRLVAPTVAAFGTITPSSNVVVERVTQAVMRDYPDVSAHFTRLRHVGATDPRPDSYDWEGMIGAARLLGHAQLDAIVWNGSKGGTIGLDKDRELVQRIGDDTGIRATTSTLTLDAVFKRSGVTRIAFVTPFLPAVQARISTFWGREGYDLVALRGAGLSDNFSFSRLGAGPISDMVRQVADARPQAIVLYCTNMLGAHVAAGLSAETGIPVYDSVSIGVAGALALLGRDTSPSRAWGPGFDAAA